MAEFRNTVAEFQRHVVDQFGNVVSNPTVEVRDHLGALAQLYATYNGWYTVADPMDNPFVGGSDGMVRFYTKSGPCNVTVTKGAFSQTWENVALGATPKLNQENVFTVPQFIWLNTPQLWFMVENAPVDEHFWFVGANLEGLTIGACADDAESLDFGIVMNRQSGTPNIATIRVKANDQIVLSAPVLVDSGTVVIDHATVPQLRLQESGAATDEGKWNLVASGGHLLLSAVSDDGESSTTIMEAVRDGVGLSSVNFYGDFSGSGSDIANLNASNLTTGTVPNARFPSTLPALNGSALTNLTAANVTGSNTLADGVLSTNVPFKNVANTFNSLQTFAAHIDVTGGLILNQVGALQLVAVGGITVQGSHVFTGGGYEQASALPVAYLNETGGAANNRLWATYAAGEALNFGMVNDAKSSFVPWLTVQRTANVADSVTVTAGDVALGALHSLADGRVYGTGLHNNGNAVTGTTNQYIASGTYTPTITNSTNVAASTNWVCCWMRVGNVVHVSGRVDIDPTSASTLTTLFMPLPVASNLAGNDLAGTAVGGNTSQALAISADSTNDRARFDGIPGSTSNEAYFFTFTYVVL